MRPKHRKFEISYGVSRVISLLGKLLLLIGAKQTVKKPF